MGNYEYKSMPESMADALEKIKAEQYAEYRSRSIGQFVSDHSGGKDDNVPTRIDIDAWTSEWRELHGDKMVGLDDCGDDVYRHYHYSVCTSCGKGSAVKTNFCPVCGKAMTPEALAMLEKRLRGYVE